MQEERDEDWEARRQRHRIARRKRNRLFVASRLLFCLFLLLFGISAWMLADQLYSGWKEDRDFSDLNAMVQEYDTPRPHSGSADPTEESQGSSGLGTAVHPQYDQNGILVKYSKLYARNPDLFGWISIADTDLSYPVMQTPEDAEYYLRRNFDGEKARSGVPFLDAACSEEGYNYMVYGHNMRNGTMFSLLESYADPAFRDQHPRIRFDTLHEEAEYEVMAAFYSRVFYQDETDVFRYYYYTDLSDPKDYADYVDWMLEQSLWDAGIDAEYGDSLLTLITCSYGSPNERFVVLAKKCP